MKELMSSLNSAKLERLLLNGLLEQWVVLFLLRKPWLLDYLCSIPLYLKFRIFLSKSPQGYVVLQNIRKARAKTLGFVFEESVITQMDYVREELEFAGRLFAQNLAWPVIDVTAKAIEETAAVVLRLYHDRKDKCTMPRISKRY